MGIYSEIKFLTKELNGSRLKQRREAGEKLQSMLSQPEVRRRLAMEVSLPEGQRGRMPATVLRRMALAELWRFIIQSAISAVQVIVDGKSKVTETDILMPYKLIRSCDLSEDVAYASTCDSIPNLDKKTTRIVFEYCMEMLDNKDTLELAELTLLQLLGYICSRREYVAYFKPHGELSAIMEEVESRVLAENNSIENSVVLEAGRVFENVIQTSNDLGIGLQLLIPGCVKLVASWCNMNKNKTLLTELPQLINGLSTLLESDPEQSVAPLTRYGRSILSFAKRRYRNAVPVHRMALDRYLLRHLITCQVAGKLQGMMPGDLGDLGPASLTNKQLASILDLLFQDLCKVSINSWPLEEPQRLQLNLVARLLASAQRDYILDAEWNQLDDPMKSTIASLENIQASDHFISLQQPYESEKLFQPCPSSALRDSPFVVFVLGPLSSLAANSAKHDASDKDSKTPNEATNIPRCALAQAAEDSSSLFRPDSKTLIPLLQVISACAELFPMGCCWTSSVGDRWRSLVITDQESDSEVLSIIRSSSEDLAVVIQTVLYLLIANGDSSGAPAVQKWILLCLIRLTEVSGAQLLQNQVSENSLYDVWRRVWFTLFRPDLRYSGWTKSTRMGTNGEMVLILLAKMIRFSCTGAIANGIFDDNNFLSIRQSDLWGLPVFRSFDGESVLPFILIYAVVYFVGLREPVRGSFEESRIASMSSDGIRDTLVSFCFQTIEKHLETPNSRCIIGFSTTCLSALSGCVSPKPEVVFHLMVDSSSISSVFLLGSSCFTNFHTSKELPMTFEYDRDLYSCLWGTPQDSRPDLHTTCWDNFVDEVRHDNQNVIKLLSLREKSLCIADSVPFRKSKQLFDFVYSRLGLLISTYLEIYHKAGNPPLETAEDSSDGKVHPLPLQTLVAKAYLTAMLSKQCTTNGLAYEESVACVSEFFKCCLRRLCAFPEERRKDVSTVLADLTAISRGVIEVSSKFLFELPPAFVESSTALSKMCENTLIIYTPGEMEEQEQTSTKSKNSEMDDFLMDDDFDEDVTNKPNLQSTSEPDSDDDFTEGRKRKRKRKPKNLFEKRGKLKQGDSQLKNIDRESAFRCSELLMTLSPSFEHCELVSKSLTGIDDFEDNLQSPYEFDIVGGVFATNLICSEASVYYESAKSFLFNKPESDNGSIPLLVCQLIRAIRSAAKPHSIHYLFGYKNCASLVELCDSDIHHLVLSEEAVSDVVELFRDPEISQERRHLMLRPSFRATQFKAAISMFQKGKANFHMIFDKIFPKCFVLPSLLDANGPIRRLACVAVASALKVLPEEKVIESVRKRLPSIFIEETEQARVEFRKWYHKMKLFAGDSNTTRENQVWEDAFVSVKCGVVDCWVAIACACSKVETLHGVLFDLVRLSAASSSSEGLAFRAIEQIGQKYQGTSAEKLLDAHKSVLVLRWLETGDSLLKMPLLFTAPQVLRGLLSQGRFRELFEIGSGEDEPTAEIGICYDQLQVEAASEFISKNTDTLLPHVFSRALNSSQPDSDTSEIVAVLANDPYIKDFCSAFDVSFDAQTVKNLVRKSMPNLLAHSAIQGILNGDGSKNVFEEILIEIFSEEDFQRQGEKNASRAILQMLKASGDVSGSVTLDQCVHSIQTVVARFGKFKSKANDLFVSVGGSTLEALIFARFSLAESCSTQEILSRWACFEVIVQFINESIRNSREGPNQLTFAINVLSELIMDDTMISIRSKAINTLTKIITEVADRTQHSAQLRKEVSPTLKNFLALVLHVHENCQQQLVEKCNEHQAMKDRIFRRSLGALSFRDSSISEGDYWGWTTDDQKTSTGRCLPFRIESYALSKNRVIVDSLVVSFALIKTLIQRARELGLSREDVVCLPVDNLSRDIQDELFRVNADFCAQRIIREFLDVENDMGEGDNDLEEEQLPVIIRRIQNKTMAQNSMSSPIMENQTLLLTELKELELFLRLENIRTDLETDEIIRLAQELSRFCASTLSEKVRLLASRCLGEINLSCIGASAITDPQDDWIGNAITSGRLLSTLKAKSIDTLIASLRSAPNISMVSLETLKAIFSSRLCDDCLDIVHDSEIAELFFHSKNSIRKSSLLLTEEEIGFVKRKYAPFNNGESWCWEMKLWHGNSGQDFSFDVWICEIVSALIDGCYVARDQKTIDTTKPGSFFVLCQRMSCLDSKFAEALFPTVVLDLLLNGNAGSKSRRADTDGVLLDTWISEHDSQTRYRLSECFSSLLRYYGSGESPERRPVELVVECLDLLRRLTQHRFVLSPNHKRNLPNTKSKGDSSGQDSAIGSVPWRGVPYGVVLEISGKLVADACIQANKYALGLFYSEMYADSRFGGSSGALAALSDDPFGQRHRAKTDDISGFRSESEAVEGMELESFQRDGIVFLNLLRKSFLKLGEQDSAHAVDQQIADLGFFSFSSMSALEGNIASFEQLQALENLCDMERGSNLAMMSLADCLEGIGLRNTLSYFVEGLQHNDVPLSEKDQDAMKEKWYMCRLFAEQWNDGIFHVDARGSLSSRTMGKQGSGAMEDKNLSIFNDNTGVPGFYECMSRAMTSLQSEDYDSFQLQLGKARLQLVKKVPICGSDYESFWKTLNVIDQLQTVNDLEMLSASPDSVINLMQSYDSRRIDIDQTGKSPSLFFRVSSFMQEITLRSLVRRSESSDELTSKIQKNLMIHLQHMASVCCDFGLLKDADSALQRLSSICQEKNKVSSDFAKLRLQRACLQETKNDFQGAIRSAKQVITCLQSEAKEYDDNQKSLLADALVKCGGWMTKHKVEPANSILTNYLRPGADLAKSLCELKPTNENTKRATSALFALGQLVSNLFESVSSRVKGVAWQNAGKGLQDRKSELAKCDSLVVEAKKRLQASKRKSSQESNNAEKELRELQIYRIHLERETQNTEAERQKIEQSVEEYRLLSLQVIVSAMSLSGTDEKGDLSKHMYRFVALWFSSEEDGAWTDSISNVIFDAIENIPSFRFVPLASQLFSRVDTEKAPNDDSCQSRLQQLLLKMCLRHPYHCVVQLLALSNGSNSAENQSKDGQGNSKAYAATLLIQTLKKKDPEFVRHLIDSYEALTSAYIHLAMADTSAFHRGNTAKIPFDKVCKSTALRLDRCLGSGGRKLTCPPCVVTKPPPLRPGGDYGDGIEDPIGGERISSFESCFAVTEGGLHRPKIVMCLGSKGGKFRELVKGEDEVRQDAVMEQVFEYVNNLMARQRVVTQIDQNVTRISTRGDLKLVTYNIIPLSPEAGVLEWVERAIPFGDFIADKGGKQRGTTVGAHSRYYPGEWGHIQCRNHLTSAKQEEKGKAFQEVCCNHSPVFRFFFVEQFGHSSEMWHAAKMRYTRSVAVSSIVGHVLGIGDRHTSNILVHQGTGEVVHIDFGIVFEQGKLLNTPEKVPFRLTRNIVDGMGPLGTEGTFTKAAEATLVALKNNTNALLTILSAIVADPLYKWSLSSRETRQQPEFGKRSGKKKSITPPPADNENDNKNEAAEHAIRKIHEKLQGYEDGTSGEQQSAEGQISLLVNSARDHDNLSVMFPGWAPWM